MRYSVALINFDKCTMILHTHHPPTSAIITRGVQPMVLIITYQFLIWESPLRHMPAAFSKFIRFQDTWCLMQDLYLTPCWGVKRFLTFLWSSQVHFWHYALVQATSCRLIQFDVQLCGVGHPYVLPDFASGLDNQRDVVLCGSLPTLWRERWDTTCGTCLQWQRPYASRCLCGGSPLAVATSYVRPPGSIQQKPQRKPTRFCIYIPVD